MAIILVRHGETPGNRDRVLQVESTPLSELGERQAELLAARLAELGIAHVLCSDLLRARMTAAPLVARTGAALELTPLLRERDFGDLRGTAYSALHEDPFAPDFVPPGGESWQVFYARVAQAFAVIRERRAAVEGNLVVITHGLVACAILQRHVSWPLSQGEPPRHLLNTSVSVLGDHAPHAPSLVNCCAHLSENTRGTRFGGAV